MSAQWNSIRNDLSRYIQSDEAARAFARAQHAQQLLQVFDSPTLVVEYLDSGIGAFKTSDTVVRSLINLAQAGTERRVAYAVLWLGLWRPLTCIHRSRMKYFKSRSELASSVAAKFHHQVERLDFSRVKVVIPTLLQNTKRDVAREAVRRLQDEDRHVGMDVDAALVRHRPELLRVDDDHVAIDCRRALSSLEQRTDHDLVLAVVVRGEPANEAAATAGISEDAARKRVERTLARVRRELAKRDRAAEPPFVPQMLGSAGTMKAAESVPTACPTRARLRLVVR